MTVPAAAVFLPSVPPPMPAVHKLISPPARFGCVSVLLALLAVVGVV
jgi:hypothetical protein